MNQDQVVGGLYHQDVYGVLLFKDLAPAIQTLINEGEQAEAKIKLCDSKAADLIVRVVDAEEKLRVTTEALEVLIQAFENRGPGMYWNNVGLAKSALAIIRAEGKGT